MSFIINLDDEDLDEDLRYLLQPCWLPRQHRGRSSLDELEVGSLDSPSYELEFNEGGESSLSLRHRLPLSDQATFQRVAPK